MTSTGAGWGPTRPTRPRHPLPAEISHSRSTPSSQSERTISAKTCPTEERFQDHQREIRPTSVVQMTENRASSFLSDRLLGAA